MQEKTISKVIKKLIIETIDAGESAHKVAERFHVGIASVSRSYKRLRENSGTKGRKRQTKEDQSMPELASDTARQD